MSGHPILVTAHAGCMGTRPNSEASFRAAFRSPADIIEADLRLSADGTVVLAHDEALPLPAKGGDPRSARVAELDWWGDRAAFAAQGIMDLEAFLDLASALDEERRAQGRSPGTLNLDMKDPGAVAPALKALRRRGAASRAILSGLYPEDLGEVRILSPDVPFLLNAERVAARGGEDMFAIAERFGCAGINLEWRLAIPGTMEEARRRGLPVYLWTVDEEAAMAAVVASSPASITTNFPEILARVIRRERGER